MNSNSLDKLKEHFLVPQNKKWRRVVDSFAAIGSFISAIIALYLLETQSGEKFPAVSSFVAWGYIITSLPVANLLYKESDIKIIERDILVLFILFSNMSLLFSIMSAYIKT